MKHALVVVNVSECFDEDRGAFERVTMWDGVELSYRTDCARSSNIRAQTTATREQIKTAAEAYKATVKPVYCVRTGENSLIGHTYVVGGSRKVAKGTHVVVIDQVQAGYDARYNRSTQAQVLVEFDGGREWIATNCLKTWLCGVAPWWSNNIGVSATESDVIVAPTTAYSATVEGIAVVCDGVSLSDVKIASAKAWAMHHGLDYYSVARGVESGDLAYKDAAIFMARVYVHLNK
jgi:hypothetical protein